MKRMKITLLTAMAILTMLFTITLVRADGPDFNNAASIPFEKGIQGNVTRGSDYQQNVYKIRPVQAGGLTVQFDHPIQNDKNKYWTVALFDDSYSSVMSYNILGNYTSATLPVIGLDAKNYYLVVKSSSRYNAVSTDIYTMTAHFDVSNLYEKENNETYKTATVIEANKMYRGSITGGSDDEKDYYRMDIANPGVIRVRFNHERQVDSEAYWIVSIFDESYNKLCERSIYGNTTGYTLPSIGVKAGSYYILMTSSSRYNVKSASCYTFTPTYQVSEVWEREFNENYATATPINLGEKYYGATSSGSDDERDFYRFTIPLADTYQIIVGSSLMNNNDQYYEMILYNSSYKEISAFKIYGNKAQHIFIHSLSSGTYYLGIWSSSRYNTRLKDDYSILIQKNTSGGQSKPSTNVNTKKVNPLSVRTKSVTVKYKSVKKKKQTIASKKLYSVSGAQGKVTFKKTGGTKKISVYSSGKILIKKGTKKGKYTIKVNVTAAGNANYYGKTIPVYLSIYIK